MEQYYSSKIFFAPHEGNYYPPCNASLTSIFIALKHFSICLMFLWLCFPLTAIGQTQTADNREQSARSLLCHKWNFKKTVDFEKTGFPVDSIGSIRFLASGYILFDRPAQAEAVWNYDNSRRILTILSNSNIWRYSVLRLTISELILEANVNKNKDKIYLWRSYN